MNKDLYFKLLLFVLDKHGKQERKNCEPYVKHLIRVYKVVEDSGYDQMYQAVALLHDVLEDTDTTVDELNSFCDMEAVESIIALTRTTKNEKEYVNKILKDKIAPVVKSADIIDNMLSARELGRIPKHRKWAINYINKAEKYYKHRFCKAVDRAIDIAKEHIDGDENLGEAYKKIGKIKI